MWQDIIIWALGILLIGGFSYYLLQSLPLIGEPFKSLGLWTIIAISGILFIIYVVIPAFRLLMGAF